MAWTDFFTPFRRKSTTLSQNEIDKQVRIFGGDGGEWAGNGNISPESAMRVSTVFACIRVLAWHIAQLPCNIYQRAEDEGRIKYIEHPLHRLLSQQPNEWQTAFEWWEYHVTHIASSGNSYAYIVRDSNDQILELLPLPPRSVKPVFKDYNLTYVVSSPNGTAKTIPARDILHFRYTSFDSVLGVSPIELHRSTITGAKSANDIANRMYRDGGMFNFYMKAQGTLSDEAIEKLGKQVQGYVRADGFTKVPVLDENAEIVPIRFDAKDMQFLEQRRLQREEICAIFGVPPHKVAEMSAATFSNIEHQAIEFVTGTIGPWVERLEQACMRDLLTPKEKDTLYIEFNLNRLLRADSTARGNYLKALHGVGALSTNQICDLENLPRAGAEGDTRYVQGNLMKLGRESIKGADEPKKEDDENKVP